jgi:transcriptional regulator with XRE-family HTH domain
MDRHVNAQMDMNLVAAYTAPYSPGMNIADRLDHLMKLRELENQSELSRVSGVPQPTINRILSGKTASPDMPTLQKLAVALRSTSSWIADGVGPGPESPDHRPLSVPYPGKGNVKVWDNSDDLEPDPDRIWIDRFDYQFSAGSGLIQWEVREKHALPFNRSFFKGVRANPDACKLMIVRGDSMEPFLYNRDMFMVDSERTRIKEGSIYAIHFEDESLVKQIFKQPGGGLMLHSFNTRYPDKVIEPTQLEYIKIVGELIYRSGSGPAGGN